nr:DUF6760 family protein [Pseudoalteromonas sp. S16_S37]
MHWSYDTLLGMEHAERQQWLNHTSAINRRVNEDNEPSSTSSSILSIT